MAEEKNEMASVPEIEEVIQPRSSSKDLWLFLIIVDVICLCVFGFFLYKNLSAKLLAPQNTPKVAQVTEELVVVETPASEQVEEVRVVEEIVPVKPVVEEPAKPVQKAEPEEPVQIAKAETTVEPQPLPTEKKESISIKKNPKSKYRQVTFRYFDEAKEVFVVSGFTMAKPRALTKKDGVWETTLAIAPGTYKYLLIVDGKQKLDPYAPQKDGRSLLEVE